MKNSTLKPAHGQTRRSSFAEAMINVAIGFAVNLLAGFVIYPALGIRVTVGSNLQITLAFTVMSIARSYIVRRWFNSRIIRAAEALTK